MAVVERPTRALRWSFGRPVWRTVRRPRSLRSIVLWLIALLLVGNGVAGIVAACVGWQMMTGMVADLRRASADVSAQQARLVESVNGVAVSVGDAAQAMAGVSQSTSNARAAVTEATETSANLATTFDRLALSSQVTVFGMRPLEGLVQPFAANAEDFRRLSGSLTQAADSLAANSSDMSRVADDLRGINSQLRTAATQIEAVRTTALLDQGLASLELGSRLLLTLIFFESLLSALVGLALVILTGRHVAGRHGRSPLLHDERSARDDLALDDVRERPEEAPLR